jgi:hypothetical protein
VQIIDNWAGEKMPTYFSIPVVDGQADINWETDSFRVMHYFHDENNVEIMYGEMNEGTVRDSWTELTEEEFYMVVPNEDEQPQETQLDRIEAKLEQSYTEAKQEGADAITAELIERGIL